jgi:hypothetical protein
MILLGLVAMALLKLGASACQEVIEQRYTLIVTGYTSQIKVYLVSRSHVLEGLGVPF